MDWLLICMPAFLLSVGLCAFFGYLLRGLYEACPYCSKRKLESVYLARSASKPSDSFYKCLACGARVRKDLNGSFKDASTAEFDQFYRSTPADPG